LGMPSAMGCILSALPAATMIAFIFKGLLRFLNCREQLEYYLPSSPN
jgi:hypothetical protein